MKLFASQRELLDCYRAERQWYVERGGTRVALLRAPVRVEMFWYAYEVVPLTDDPTERANILAPAYWAHDHIPVTTFWSSVFGHQAAAFWSDYADGKLVLRGLYHGEPASWWDRLVVRGLIQLGY